MTQHENVVCLSVLRCLASERMVNIAANDIRCTTEVLFNGSTVLPICLSSYAREMFSEAIDAEAVRMAVRQTPRGVRLRRL